jgi:hypothetical protein
LHAHGVADLQFVVAIAPIVVHRRPADRSLFLYLYWK